MGNKGNRGSCEKIKNHIIEKKKESKIMCENKNINLNLDKDIEVLTGGMTADDNFYGRTKNVSSSMRNVTVRISKYNKIHVDNDILGLKAGDTYVIEYDEVLEGLKNWAADKKFTYYMVAHNVDTEDEHYHIVLCFVSPTQFEALKRRFPYGYIAGVKRSVRAAIQYLVHKNQPEKEQLSWDRVATNAPRDVFEEYQHDAGQKEQEILSDLVRNLVNGKVREYEIFDYDPQFITRYNNRIQSAIKLGRRKAALNPNRKVNVIVLAGCAGAGKTLFAKAYAEKKDKSICISSASESVFESYSGQDILVLDDMDFNKLGYQDLLKAIDPKVNSKVHCRYEDNIFLGDTIFITSNKNILDWYPDITEFESKALYRRIKCIMWFDKPMTNNGIIEYSLKSVTDLKNERKNGIDNKYVTHKFDVKKYIDLDDDEEDDAQLIEELCNM